MGVRRAVGERASTAVHAEPAPVGVLTEESSLFGDRRMRQTTDTCDPSVRTVGERPQQHRGRPSALGECQGHPVTDVGLDRERERVRDAAVEKDGGYLVTTRSAERLETVRAVDDGHGRSVHENRRHAIEHLAQHLHMTFRGRLLSRREAALQLGDVRQLWLLPAQRRLRCAFCIRLPYRNHNQPPQYDRSCGFTPRRRCDYHSLLSSQLKGSPAACVDSRAAPGPRPLKGLPLMRPLLARAFVTLVAAAGCVMTAAPRASAASAARPVASAKTCYDIWIFLLTPGKPITICL
jgi:hypothetical protein